MTTQRERVALIASLVGHATGGNDEALLAEIELVLAGATIADLNDLRRVR